jgi:hypothetical protein
MSRSVGSKRRRFSARVQQNVPQVRLRTEADSSFATVRLCGEVLPCVYILTLWNLYRGPLNTVIDGVQRLGITSVVERM